jgi:hypothetical protein
MSGSGVKKIAKKFVDATTDEGTKSINYMQ